MYILRVYIFPIFKSSLLSSFPEIFCGAPKQRRRRCIRAAVTRVAAARPRDENKYVLDFYSPRRGRGGGGGEGEGGYCEWKTAATRSCVFHREMAFGDSRRMRVRAYARPYTLFFLSFFYFYFNAFDTAGNTVRSHEA